MTKIIRLGCICCAAGLATGAFADVYRVKRGDALSAIALHHLKGPVWGKSGGLQKLLALNGWIKNPDLIFPGQTIELGPSPVATTRIPAGEPVTNSDAARPYGVFTLLPSFSFSRIDATDLVNGGSGAFISGLNPGFDFSWRQIWNPSWQTFLDLGLVHQSFSGPSGKILNNPDPTTTDFFLGVERRVTDRFSLGARIGMSQGIFVRGASATNVNLDSVAIPEIQGAVSLELVRRSPFTISAFAKGGYLFPGATDTYDIHAGSDLSGGVSAEQDLDPGLKLVGRGFYQSESQNSSIATETVRQMGFSLGIAWSLR